MRSQAASGDKRSSSLTAGGAWSMGAVSISAATVERLAVYRRWLALMFDGGRGRVYSRDLALLGQVTAAQARRDMSAVGFGGSSAHGYDVAGLVAKIDDLLNPTANESVALVGVGQLGRIVLGYLTTRRPAVRFAAAFDSDPDIAGRVLHGVRCHAMRELPRLAQECAFSVGVLTVPASAAQDVALALVECGIRGILNFALARLRVPPEVYVENVDIATLLAKTAFFARRSTGAVEADS